MHADQALQANHITQASNAPAPATHIDPLWAVAIGASVAGTFLVHPKFGPDMSPADVLIGISVIATLVLAPRRLRIPFSMLLGFVMLAGTGMISVLWTGDTAPVVTFLKTLSVWLWAMCILAMARAPGGKRLIITAVAISAGLGAATVLLRKYGVHLGPLDMFLHARTIRPAGSYGNPNLAASHLLVGILLTPLLFRRSPVVVLWVGVALMALRAFLLTKSLAGFGALAFALLAALPVFALTRQFRARIWLLAAAIIVAGVAAWRVYPLVSSSPLELAAGIGAGRFSRLADRMSDRSELVARSLAMWRTSPVIGIGRGRIKGENISHGARRVGGHNEYISTLAEAGVIGFVGLMILFGTPVVRALRALIADHPETPLVAVCLCALAGQYFLGATHDIVHFRHLWILIALLLSVPDDGRLRLSSTEPTKDQSPLPSDTARRATTAV